MKKYLIFGLLILALAAFVIVPFFKNKNVVSDNATDDLPAMFSFKENLATKGDEVVALKIAINSSEIKLMQIFYGIQSSIVPLLYPIFLYVRVDFQCVYYCF